MKLRPYQQAAIDQTSALLAKHKNLLIVAPTSSGKSLIIGGICARAVARGRRVLCLTHQAEILVQNEKCLKAMAPHVKTSVYCAGLGRKETEGQVIFASRDSLGASLEALGKFELVIVDEAHLISTNKETRYQKIFRAVGAQWVVGLTGTPWRLDNGPIWGKRKFFEKISYNIALDFLIEQGFICRYVFPSIESLIDTANVKVSKATGDFDEKELSEVSATEEIVAKAIDHWQLAAKSRKCSIFFCCSIAHANMVFWELKLRGIEAGYIDGQTSDEERLALFERARHGGYKALVNVGVLTTGVDIKPIDCVVMLRATKSAALFIQCCGRGLRVHPGKENLLILDFAGNFERFNDLSEPFIQEPIGIGKEKECQGCKKLSQPGSRRCRHCGLKFESLNEGPKKKCPECEHEQSASSRVCSFCSHVFINHDVSTYSKEKKTDFEVESHDVIYTKTKAGEECAIVKYNLKGARTEKEWILYKRPGPFGFRNQARLRTLLTHRVNKIRITKKPTSKFSDIYILEQTKLEPGETIGTLTIEPDKDLLFG